jgi:hypothetical protein
LLALEQHDVTELLLHLVASARSTVLRVALIALHSSGFTAASFARASVNSLYEITDAERNVLRLNEFLHENSERIVVGKAFPVMMVGGKKRNHFDSNVVSKGSSIFGSKDRHFDGAKSVFNCSKTHAGRV